MALFSIKMMLLFSRCFFSFIFCLALSFSRVYEFWIKKYLLHSMFCTSWCDCDPGIFSINAFVPFLKRQSAPITTRIVFVFRCHILSFQFLDLCSCSFCQALLMQHYCLKAHLINEETHIVLLIFSHDIRTIYLYSSHKSEISFSSVTGSGWW